MKIHWKKEKLKNEVLMYANSNRVTARRMKTFDSAVNFLDLVPDSNGRAHFLKLEYKGCFALDLERKGNGKRLICKPKGNYIVENNHFIKETITEFEVIKIIDYHN